MPPHPVSKKEAPAPAAMPKMIEEKVQKVRKHLAEKCHCKASKECREVEEIERMEKQAAEQKVARECEEKAAKEREKACMEATHKAVEEKKAKEQAEAAQKATEVKKAEGSKGKGPMEVSGSPRKVSQVLHRPYHNPPDIPLSTKAKP
jgi:hypothetical protein